MVDEQIDNIILGLTRMSTTADLTGMTNGHSETDVFTVTLDESPWGIDAVNRFMEERDWSDGDARGSAHAGAGGGDAERHPGARRRMW